VQVTGGRDDDSPVAPPMWVVTCTTKKLNSDQELEVISSVKVLLSDIAET
jgi:hypothetical protein